MSSRSWENFQGTRTSTGEVGFNQQSLLRSAFGDGTVGKVINKAVETTKVFGREFVKESRADVEKALKTAMGSDAVKQIKNDVTDYLKKNPTKFGDVIQIGQALKNGDLKTAFKKTANLLYDVYKDDPEKCKQLQQTLEKAAKDPATQKCLVKFVGHLAIDALKAAKKTAGSTLGTPRSDLVGLEG